MRLFILVFLNLILLTIVCESHKEKNKKMVKHLQERGAIIHRNVKNAMLTVDRENYSKMHPYRDTPQSIGYGATISAPHMHAAALELLIDHLTSGEKALDVGCGTGYLTACMATMLGEKGTAVGIDHIPELADMARENIEKDQPELLKSGRVKLIVGDGRLGVPELGPYNAIHVGAAALEVPQALVDQLKEGGRMIIPIGEEQGLQELHRIDKLPDGKIKQKSLMNVAYIPLTDKAKQIPRPLQLYRSM